MKKFDRITAILIQLQSKRVVKAQDLADRFEVTLRTIYRDIKTLEGAGVPIIGEAGVGYSIMDGYRLPPVMFTNDEATSFLLAEKLLDKIADKTTRKHFESAMFKIRSVLRSSERDAVDELDDFIEVAVSPSTFTSKIQHEHLPILLQAIKAKNILNLHYKKEHVKEESKRMIEPLGIYFSMDNWHLLAYCQTRKDYRDFRLDRMTRLVPTNNYFDAHRLTIQEYLKRWTSGREEERVVVSFSKTATQFAKNQKYYYGLIDEVQKEDRIEMTFLTYNIPGMARWLLIFGDQIDIIYPNKLNTEMVKLAKLLSNHYT